MTQGATGKAPHFWPSETQELLLRAALAGDRSEALGAWRAWRARSDFEALDDESYRLVPLLHHNLRRHGVDDPALGRYGGIARRAWLDNRLRFRDLAALVAKLSAAGIPTMALKGVVLALRVYPKVGLRTMRDCDLLVPTARARETLELLDELGWRTLPLPSGQEFFAAALGTHHSWAFGNGTGRDVDLHWHACADHCGPGDDADFWSAALPFEVEGVRTSALAPTDLLFHTLAHAYASHGGVIRWVADAAMELQAEGARIDWARLARLAGARGLVPPVRVALDYLAGRGLARLPPAAQGELARAPVRLLDRLEYRHRLSRDPYSLANKAQRLIFWGWRSAGRPGLVRTAAAMPGFLRMYFDRGPQAGHA